LRSPRLWKIAEFKIGDNVVRSILPKKAVPTTSRAVTQNAPLWPSQELPPHRFPILVRHRWRWRPRMPFR
jgi:hypothetical protein